MKKYLIPLIVAVVIILGSGFYFLVLNKSNSQKVNTQVQEQEAKTIQAEDIGLVLTPRADKKAVNMEIANLSGISSIEYEVSYDAEVIEEGEKMTIPRGVVNSPIEIKSGESEVKREVLLGTCSRNVCKYDKVISEVKFVFKVNYSNGEIGSLEESISL